MCTADHNEHYRYDEKETSHKRSEYDHSSTDSDTSESGSTSEGDAYVDSEEGEYEVRKQILDAALPFVHSYGWSQEAIVQGMSVPVPWEMCKVPNSSITLLMYVFFIINKARKARIPFCVS